MQNWGRRRTEPLSPDIALRSQRVVSGVSTSMGKVALQLQMLITFTGLKKAFPFGKWMRSGGAKALPRAGSGSPFSVLLPAAPHDTAIVVLGPPAGYRLKLRTTPVRFWSAGKGEGSAVCRGVRTRLTYPHILILIAIPSQVPSVGLTGIKLDLGQRIVGTTACHLGGATETAAWRSDTVQITEG
jgi:hypothetical protein